MPNVLAPFTPEVWSTKVIEKLYQSNVALSVMANTDYDGEIKAPGATIWVRTYGRITMQPYSKGSPISYQNLAPTKESLTVNDSQAFAFQVDDLDVAQSDLNIIDGYAREGAIAISELVDSKVFSYFSAAATANKITNSSSPYTISSSNAYTLILDCNKALDDQNAPQVGRWMIVSSNYKKLLAQDTNLLKGLNTADQILQSGRPGQRQSDVPNFIGNVAGTDIFWSNNLPRDASGVYAIYGQGKPVAYGAAFNNVETIRLESTFATAVRGLILHDGAVFAEPAKRLGTLYIDK